MQFGKIQNLYLREVPHTDVWRETGILNQCADVYEEAELVTILNESAVFNNDYRTSSVDCWELEWITVLMYRLYFKCKESDVKRVFREFRRFTDQHIGALITQEDVVYHFVAQYERN